MPTKPPLLFPSDAKLMTELGERLRLARLRREFSAETVAVRAGITRFTLTRLEKGEPAVSIGVLLRVLSVLNLEGDIALLATDDKLGRRLQDLGLPIRKRARKASS